MATWIDFKELRRQLRFVDVLRHYNVELKIKGDRATGLCPLPTHPQRADGRRTPSFSAHLSKGIWRCFGCGKSGNVAEFGSRMERLDPDDPAQFRQAALKLAEIFGLSFSRPTANDPIGKGGENATRSSRVSARDEAVGSRVDGATQPSSASRKSVVVNAPIDFQLKSLNPAHPYLLKRGLSRETVDHFGLGSCSRGLMKDRIAIPIHDQLSRLVGYAGRLVDDEKIDDEHPRYLFPKPRERDGTIYEFHRSLLVYNLHRLISTPRDVIVVEGFASVWWLHQQGFANVVALMGNSCSEGQADLIANAIDPAGRIWLIPDGDAGGEQLAAGALLLLASRHFARLVKLTHGRQPTELSSEELKGIFDS